MRGLHWLLLACGACGAALLGCPAALEDPERFSSAQSSTTPSCDAPALLVTHCASCHGGAAPTSAVAIDSPSAVEALRGKRSTGGAGLLVDPAAPLQSILYAKIVAPTFGMVMPPTGALQAKDVSCVKAWLEGLAGDGGS
jgi:hypothetical protein